MKRGLKNDAALLESKDRFIETAADLSAAQRASNLHLARTMKLFGLDAKADEQTSRAGALTLVYARFPDASPVAGDAATVTVAAAEADDPAAGDGMNLEFENDDDESDDNSRAS